MVLYYSQILTLGGLILLRLEDDESIDDFISADPFAQSGIQEYRIRQFDVFQIQDFAKEWTQPLSE